jgi:hypothetical protein
MAGGTTFHFVDPKQIRGGLDGFLDLAFGGGGRPDCPARRGSRHHPAITAGRPDDELWLAFVPVLLGQGERLLDNLGDEPIGYECGDMVCSAPATNVRFVRKSTSATDAPSVGGTTA